MEIVCEFDKILSLLCKAKGKYGMYLSWNLWNLSNDGYSVARELKKACPILPDDILFLHDGFTYLFFDSYEEMNHAYLQVVGDDGPTSLNSYDGPERVYACTCDDQGKPLTENT